MDNDVFQFSADSTDYSASTVSDTAQDTAATVLPDDSFATDAVTAVTHNPLDDAQQSITFDIAPNVTVNLGGFTMDDYLALVNQDIFGGSEAFGASFAGQPHGTLTYTPDGFNYALT